MRHILIFQNLKREHTKKIAGDLNYALKKMGLPAGHFTKINLYQEAVIILFYINCREMQVAQCP